MATEKLELPTDEKTPAPPSAALEAVVQDSPTLDASYANFARVTGSPEELILDFGLNPQPLGAQQKPILVSRRIILNYYTAKRLLGVLSMTVQRHEQVFGVLETDINKRVTIPASRTGRQSS